MKLFIKIFILLSISFSGFSQLKLAQLFSDHVVLQRQKNIPIWGWAAPNESIKVEFFNQTQTVNSDETGKWMVKFLPMEAGGPYTLFVSTKTEKLKIEDILIGEVWLLSGQSNME
jgi:sialate O-acetylesterase